MSHKEAQKTQEKLRDAFVYFVPLCGYFFRVAAAFFAERDREAAERFFAA